MIDIPLGTYQFFTVIKVESSQYIVQKDKITLALPKKDATKPLTLQETVEVFIYANHNKHIVATMHKPKIDLHTAALVDVVDAKFGLGVFVDVGLDKDMLVSRDDLPVLKKQWPLKGDRLFCYMKSGKNQLSAKPVSRFKMFDYFTPEDKLEVGDSVDAYVFYIADEGLVLYTDAGHEIFVYYKHARADHRLGELVTVTITIEKDELHYNGTLIEQKEIMISKDAEAILAYLKAHEGVLNLGDKSSPEDIFAQFHMSKAAFKRALGTLYKMELVTLEKTKTVLKDN